MIAFLSALSTGCGSDLVRPEPALRVQEILVTDASSGELVAYSHQDHWHGVLRQRTGESRALSLHFTSSTRPPSEHEAPPRTEWFTLDTLPAYQLRVVVEDTAVARWTGAAAGGSLSATRGGATYVNFVVRRGTTTIFEAPPLGLGVTP